MGHTIVVVGLGTMPHASNLRVPLAGANYVRLRVPAPSPPLTCSARISGSPFLVARQTTTDHISDPSCTMSAGGDELPAARPLSTSGNNELINPLHGDATAIKATRTRAASGGVQGRSPSLSPPVGRARSARSNSRSERSERVKRLTSLKMCPQLPWQRNRTSGVRPRLAPTTRPQPHR